MSNKYNECITITRTGESSIKIECKATTAHMMRSIIGLFEDLKKLDKTAAICVMLNLIEILEKEEKKEA